MQEHWIAFPLDSYKFSDRIRTSTYIFLLGSSSIADAQCSESRGGCGTAMKRPALRLSWNITLLLAIVSISRLHVTPPIKCNFTCRPIVWTTFYGQEQKLLGKTIRKSRHIAPSLNSFIDFYFVTCREIITYFILKFQNDIDLSYLRPA